MKIFRIIGLFLALFFVILLIYSLTLPKDFEIKRGIIIKTSPEYAFEQIINLNKWQIWSIWNKNSDSSLSYNFKTNDNQLKSTMEWNGNIIGKGSITLIESQFNEKAKFKLDIENGKFESIININITKLNDDVKIEWIENGELGSNPFSRLYAYLIIDKVLGNDAERNLASLKKYIEH